MAARIGLVVTALGAACVVLGFNDAASIDPLYWWSVGAVLLVLGLLFFGRIGAGRDTATTGGTPIDPAGDAPIPPSDD